MEKRAINFSVKQIISRFRHVGEENFNATTLWHAIFWAEGVCIILIAVFAYMTYDWAISISTTPPSHTSRDTFSASDLKNLITYYEAKEGDYNKLLGQAPIAPTYQRVKQNIASTTASTTKATQTDESNDVFSTPTPTQ